MTAGGYREGAAAMRTLSFAIVAFVAIVSVACATTGAVSAGAVGSQLICENQPASPHQIVDSSARQR